MTTHSKSTAATGKHGSGGGQDSQCYFVQLQIDSFLDGDLGSAQQDALLGHIKECADCSSELQFARLVHDAVLDLPLLNCPDGALEPINRLHNERSVQSSPWWQGLSDWFEQLPRSVRYAFPAVLAVAVTLWVLPADQQPAQPVNLIAEQVPPAAPDYTQADVLEALADLNTAITYLNEVSQRTETMIGGRFVVMPLQESLNASFQRLQDEESDHLSDDPI